MRRRDCVVLLAAVAQCGFVAAADVPKNSFANPSFELGREAWQLQKAGTTECRFSVEQGGAAQGQSSALLALGAVAQWGVQFGQTFSAGAKGTTYTLAAFVKGVEGKVEVGLEIERGGSPYDRAARLAPAALTSQWQEIHTTFRVARDFPEGWFAYVSCTRPNVRFQVDMVRLYEGTYIPYTETAAEADASVRVSEESGAVVLANDRVAVTFRRGASGAELSARDTAPCAVVRPGGTSEKVALTKATIVENDAGASAVEAVFTGADGKACTLKFVLEAGQPFVKTEAGDGVARLRVEAPARFAVMPDFFADDIVFDARELPVAECEAPADNVLLQLLPGGRQIVVSVTKTNADDVRLALSGEGAQRVIESAEHAYGKDGAIWVAVIAAPNVWHVWTVTKARAGEVIDLGWMAPFAALWRVDWRRDAGVTDSWEMAVGRPDGGFVKHGLFGEPTTLPANRRRWTTVLGEFPYPCWLDAGGQGFLQPLKSPALAFDGPVLIYPIGRTPESALDTFTVVDIVRNTLGVGPCEYVLDVEGQGSVYKGKATCAVRDTLNPIYAAKAQRAKKAEIEKTLDDLMIFIRFIRARIEAYVEVECRALEYLAREKAAHPELAERIAELEQVVRTIDAKVAARKKEIKTPDDVAAMVAEFRAAVLTYEGADALARCTRFTEAWVEIGGNQDELVGECRWVIKLLRQRAGLVMAADPRMAEICKELRQRCQVALRNPASHEGARH